LVDVDGRGDPKRLGGIALAIFAVFMTFMTVMFFIMFVHTPAHPLAPFSGSVRTSVLVAAAVSCVLALALASASVVLLVKSVRTATSGA
jgi:hypothetical protein